MRIYSFVFFQSKGLVLTQPLVFSAESPTTKFIAKTSQFFTSIGSLVESHYIQLSQQLILIYQSFPCGRCVSTIPSAGDKVVHDTDLCLSL